MIDSIADYLEDNGIGTVGTDIFIGELPLDENNIISLVTSPSPEPNKAIPYFNQAVDVWARYSSYDDGYKKLQDVFDLIHQLENYDIDGFHVYLSYARGMIDDLGRDAEGRHLFKVSFSFVGRKGDEFS